MATRKIQGLVAAMSLVVGLLAGTCLAWAEPTAADNADTRTIVSHGGAEVIQKLIKRYGIRASLEQVSQQCGSRQGVTSLYDLNRALREEGLDSQTVELDLKRLQELAPSHDLIVLLGEQNTYVLIESVDEDQVTFFDPRWSVLGSGLQSLPCEQFQSLVKGPSLAVSGRLSPRK